MNELEALVALSTAPLLGPIKIRLLIQMYGSALAVLNGKEEELEKLPGFGPKLFDGWKHWLKSRVWEKELELVRRWGVSLIAYQHPLYPKRLLEIPDAPVLLYVWGELKTSDRQSIAVVGTRNPTIYGSEMAQKFGRDLASKGLTVVSGLARGIDTAAHLGALKQGGRTIAVIGSGLADIYPPENRQLAAEIAKNGAVISEFPMTTPPDRQNFPQRNRIVSGMCFGVLLVEAPLKSGAMITMNKAEMHHRKLFAIPGRADGDQFRGNHHLIKAGRAQLVENAEDLLASFENLLPLQEMKPRGEAHQRSLDEKEENFLRLLPTEEVTFEEICRLSNLPVGKLNVILMSLVLKKAIREYPGKIYKKLF
jgi:DNA processing protein